jgi:hypothetical protein
MRKLVIAAGTACSIRSLQQEATARNIEDIISEDVEVASAAILRPNASRDAIFDGSSVLRELVCEASLEVVRVEDASVVLDVEAIDSLTEACFLVGWFALLFGITA